MAEEEIKYTIAADANGNHGSQVDLIVTYDEGAPLPGDHDYDPPTNYLVTAATGIYQTLDASGNVIHTDTITGLIDPGGFAGNDNLLHFRGDGLTIFDPSGISYTISDPADGNDDAGHVNFYGATAFAYGEAGDNQNETSEATAAPVCFVEGTRIRTARGDVAVEALAVGDEVVTVSGQYRPIRWIGHRRIDCRRADDPGLVHPIRIVAGAFGQGRPARDLMLSPGHAICVSCVDEVLIPVASLVNGSTIAQIEVDEVIYWHVELDSHDILLADGLPAESYMDVGNRAFFATGDGAVDTDRDAQSLSHYCRPFVTRGALVRAVRERLRARSARLGWSLDPSPHAGLHVIADRQRIAPEIDGLALHFRFPADAQDVRLVSRAAIPSEFEDCVDDRRLGVQLRALSLADDRSERRSIPINHPALSDGFHRVEGEGKRRFRWTSGSALLPAHLWDGCRGDVSLRVELAGPSLPCWVSPAGADDDVSLAARIPPLREAPTPALKLVGGLAASRG